MNDFPLESESIQTSLLSKFLLTKTLVLGPSFPDFLSSPSPFLFDVPVPTESFCTVDLSG